MRIIILICVILKFMSVSMRTDCGISYSLPSVRIVGGVEASPNSWPSMAYVEFRYKKNIIFNNVKSRITTDINCGGTLISKSVVMTAAHCFLKHFTYQGQKFSIETNEYYKTYASMFTVYLGIHNKSDNNNKHSVKSEVLHILLVRLKRLYLKYFFEYLNNFFACFLNSMKILMTYIYITILHCFF